MRNYLYQIDNNKKYIYFINPKCASRTFFKVFNYKPVKFRKLNPEAKDYFSWTFVRNPFARLVSAYENKIVDKHQSGLNEFRKIKNFKSFVLKIKNINLAVADRHIRHQHLFFPDNIKFIGKMENLQEDFNTICEEINIQNIKLPHINKSSKKNYKEYYDAESIEIVSKKYSEDIKRFGYEF